MARLTPRQRAWRARIEAVLRVAAPALDVVVIGADRTRRLGVAVERTVVRVARRPRASQSSDRNPA
ncbi:hypothetical protein [Patulibacter sp. SYSU D01012]|uniref:hypothetical protein n=1 Tax=Patulibacter sp. SYSU D01012 TaxID=2817381 RepID=UPI001B30BAF7|nr:hypothetical protein [Patulibacter sp. SYSU D01012]